MQITAFKETFNLKHNTIVLGISSYYPQKYMSGTPLKCQKRWGFRRLRPLTPTKGLCPLDPRRGHRPGSPPPQIKMKWRPWNTHSFKKRRASPLRPLEIIYFCKFRPKRAWNSRLKLSIFSSHDTKSSIGKGAPVNASSKELQSSVCSLRLQLFEPPPPVENLPKPICTCKLSAMCPNIQQYKWFETTNTRKVNSYHDQ